MAHPAGKMAEEVFWMRFAGLLHGMKAAGIDAHPHNHTPEAYAAGQAALLLFSINMMTVAIGHGGQLATEERFVYEPNAAHPHESGTLRFVRLLDFVVMVCWAGQMCRVGLRLRTRRITPAQGYSAVMGSMICAVIAYLLGAVADSLQCNFQAGGIGTHCNGNSCLRVAAATLVCFVIGRWRPRLFFLFCFGMQGALRLEWAKRGDLPDALRAIVLVFAITLLTLPALVYLCELAAPKALIFSKASSGTGPGKVSDLEMAVSGTEHQSASSLLKLFWIANKAAETLSPENMWKRDCPKLAINNDSDRACPSVCVEAILPEQLRLKEDDGRAGAGCSPSSESTECTPEACPSPEAVLEACPSHEAVLHIPARKKVAFCDSVVPNEDMCDCTKLKGSDRKRKRRGELNTLVSALDNLLPAEARHGGFKGAGPRSAGVMGRSLINVLSDTVEHLKILEARALSRKPRNLRDLRMTYRDGEPRATLTTLLNLLCSLRIPITSRRSTLY